MRPLHLVRDGEPVIRSVPARCSICYEPLAVVARHDFGCLLAAPHRCERSLDPRLISVACFVGAALLLVAAAVWKALS